MSFIKAIILVNYLFTLYLSCEVGVDGVLLGHANLDGVNLRLQCRDQELHVAQARRCNRQTEDKGQS